MILAGDIGGTKTNLALFDIEDNRLALHVKRQFSSSEYANLSDMIDNFEEISGAKIDAACFGIAGPVINGHCQTTNLPWEITTSTLQEYLGVEKVRLLNDLEATAYGMLFLSEDEFVTLNPTERSIEGNRAIIAAGTGLGEGMLFYDGRGYHPVGSEGGHCDFAPVTPQQDALLKWLRGRFPEHVSYERILSGPGIYTLYEFLKESGYALESTSMIEMPEGKDRSAAVSECALREKDPLCLETLRLFVEIYGAEAGNLALKVMSLGGLYIGGGIAPKIVPFMKNEDFMKAFVGKGRFEALLRGMQVKIALNPETALYGAANYAFEKL
ncbi:MAG: glucokinase [Campylobacterota bacterium]|nr:glucokinase [Campylobacterota bacterium]